MVIQFEYNFKALSMKKGENESIRKLKLDDYEIGRVLGKGML